MECGTVRGAGRQHFVPWLKQWRRHELPHAAVCGGSGPRRSRHGSERASRE